MIDVFDARQIAGEWHGGQASALYAFASSGHISDELLTEIERDLMEHHVNDADDADDVKAYDDLTTLWEFVNDEIKGRKVPTKLRPFLRDLPEHAIFEQATPLIIQAAHKGDLGPHETLAYGILVGEYGKDAYVADALSDIGIIPKPKVVSSAPARR